MAKLNNLIINENGIEKKAILYDKDFAPAKIIHNGNVLTNVSFRDKLVEGTNQVTYQSEYKKNLLKLNIEGNTIQTLLPIEYQQVEYIESTGTEWIDTGFIANQNTRVVVDFQLTDIYASFIFGSRKGTTQAFTFNISGTNFVSAYGSSGNQYISVADLNRHIVDKNKNTIYFDGAKAYAGSLYTFETPTTIALFACNDTNVSSGYLPTKMKLYSCQIYDNGTIVRNYIPCYRKSDNVIGLYDLVNGVFYTNQGTGTFLKGENYSFEPSPTQPQEIVNASNISVELSVNESTTTVQSDIYLASQDKLLVNYIDKSVKVNRAYVKLNLASLNWLSGISSTTNITFFYAFTPYQFTGTGSFNRGEVKTVDYAQLNELQNTVIVEGAKNQIEIAFSPDFDLKLDSNATKGDVDKLRDWLSNNPCEVLLKISSVLEETYTGETWASDLLALPTQNATNIITVNSTIPTTKLSVDYAEWGGKYE